MDNIYLLFGLLLGFNIGIIAGFGFAYRRFDKIITKLLLGSLDKIKKACANDVDVE